MLHGFEAQGSQRASPLQSQLGISFPPCSLLGDSSRVAELGSSDAAFARIARGRGDQPTTGTSGLGVGHGTRRRPNPGSPHPATIGDKPATADLTLTEAELAELDLSEVPRGNL